MLSFVWAVVTFRYVCGYYMMTVFDSSIVALWLGPLQIAGCGPASCSAAVAGSFGAKTRRKKSGHVARSPDGVASRTATVTWGP